MSLILLNKIKNLDDDYEVESVDLNQDYWYPEQEGELKRLVFWEIGQRKCLDQQSGKQIELDCVIFIEPCEEGHRSIANGSKRLVAMFENNDIEQGTPVQVTYRGKKKNKTNSNQSDHWSVQTLRRKGGSA